MASPNYFILARFEPLYWCEVLQARFEVPDETVLRNLLGAQADDDPDLKMGYFLGSSEVEAIVTAFGVAFDPVASDGADADFVLYRFNHRIVAAPYLIHTRFELLLLLDGQKKLAKMGDAYPPMTFDGEERFDHWVAAGRLHKQEFLEPFDPPIRKYEGHRTVYYTLKGEEWRIPAMQLIWHASRKSGGWNESFERLEGMLFGYEDWQNDWWIEAGQRRGGFGGSPLCCAVTATGLAWITSAGFRALPPCDGPTLKIQVYDDADDAKMRAFLHMDPDSVALVRFVVRGKRAHELLPPENGAEGWELASDRIPELNRLLRNPVVVALPPRAGVALESSRHEPSQ